MNEENDKKDVDLDLAENEISFYDALTADEIVKELM